MNIVLLLLYLFKAGGGVQNFKPQFEPCFERLFLQNSQDILVLLVPGGVSER